MIILWILFASSVVILPGTALLAFWWALRHGEFDHLQRTALSIFDEHEPVGSMSDHFPDAVCSHPAARGTSKPSST